MDLNRHMEAAQGYHLMLTMERTSSFEQEVTKLNHNLQERDEHMARLQEQCDRSERCFAEMSAKMVDLERNAERYTQLEVHCGIELEGLLSTAFALGKSGRGTSFSALPIGMAAHSAHQRHLSVGRKIAAIDRQVRNDYNKKRWKENGERGREAGRE